MSPQVPNFKLGDRVRVMQTSDMESRGTANKKGIVTAIASKTASVRFDGEETTTRQISFSHLMEDF